MAGLKYDGNHGCDRRYVDGLILPATVRYSVHLVCRKLELRQYSLPQAEATQDLPAVDYFSKLTHSYAAYRAIASPAVYCALGTWRAAGDLVGEVQPLICHRVGISNSNP